MLSQFAHGDDPEEQKKNKENLEYELSAPLKLANSNGAAGTQVRDPKAPSWWHGDEDAAQSSIAAMGLLRKRK